MNKNIKLRIIGLYLCYGGQVLLYKFWRVMDHIFGSIKCLNKALNTVGKRLEIIGLLQEAHKLERQGAC